MGVFVRHVRVPQYLVCGDCSMNEREEVLWVCGVALESWIDESNHHINVENETWKRN